MTIDYDCVKIGKDNFPSVINNEQAPNIYTFEYRNKKNYPLVENELYDKQVFSNINKYRINNIKTFIKNIHRFKAIVLIAIIKDLIKRRL